MNDANVDNVRFVDPAAVAPLGATFTGAEIAILDQVNDRIAARQSLEEVIDYLFESTRSISPCDRIGVAFLDDDGRIVSHHTAAAYEPVLLKKGYAEDLRGSSLGGVLDGGRPRIIGDLERYGADHPRSRSTRLLVREGVRSSLTCPLRVEDRIVGVMFRSARVSGVYDDRQVALFLAVAERLGQAVEKTWRIERLEAANQAYGEMLGFVAHELKSPVASMVTQARLMLEGYAGPLAEQQEQLLGRMTAAGEHLLRLVADYLDLARLESRELRIEAEREVDFVAAVVEPALAVVQPQIDAKRMRLARAIPDPPPRVELDPGLLKIVLVNLLSNAAKYGYEEGEIRLSAAVEDGALRAAVRNDGPGFAESERSRLFRKFSRLKSPRLRQEKGTGVGLYTVWRIVSLHGGRVDARSEPDAWAEFTFEIPQPLPDGGGRGAPASA